MAFTSVLHRDNRGMHKVCKLPSPTRRPLKRHFGSDYEHGKLCQSDRITKPHLRLKKRRNPEIFGQKLSLDRVLETLDKDGLRQMIMTIVNEHPQLSYEISNMSPKVTVDSALSALKLKLDNIIDNLPYKVDPTSDYSFLRVKGYALEFFQALSDYTLSYLLPTENNLTDAIHFMLKTLVDIFCKLPKFQAVEFRYYYKLTVDKFNSILLDTVSNFISERKQNILLIINEGWLEKFIKINELNDNAFMRPYQYLREQVDAYRSPVNSNEPWSEINSEASTGTATTAATSTTSNNNNNRLEGLSSLLNFSTDNNPLNGSTVGNVYDAI